MYSYSVKLSFLLLNFSAAAEPTDRTEPVSSEYDVIPYACSDDYDIIEEVTETDEVLVTNICPRIGPLPSPNYSGLESVESQPPGVYSRMEHKRNSTEDEERDIFWNNQQTNPERPTPDQSTLQEMGDPSAFHSYLTLESNTYKDIAQDGETYLKTGTESLRSNAGIHAIEFIQKDYSNSSHRKTHDSNSYLELIAEKENAEKSEEISSEYLTVREEALSNSENNVCETIQNENSNSRCNDTLDLNSYLELIAEKEDEEIAEQSEELPSEYLLVREKLFQSNSENNVNETIQDEDSTRKPIHVANN